MIKSYTILLIDDDPQVIGVLNRLLSENENMDLISVDTLTKAKQVLDNVDIHLIIIDYNLPDGNGISFVEKIREKASGLKYLPVIMLSGEGNNIKVPALQKGVNIFLGKPFNGKELLAIVNNLLELLDAYESLEQAQTIITALIKAVETRDSYTEGHSKRVAEYSLMLYDEIGFDDYEERSNLEIGCLLHDIGKLGTSDGILKSEDRLTEEQRLEVQKHPKFGFEICKDLKNLQGALPIIRYHHEKMNGSGYPDNLKGDEIEPIVQMSAIADIYDALTSKRAYRTENTNTDAFRIMDKMTKDGELNSYFYDMFKSLILKKENE